MLQYAEKEARDQAGSKRWYDQYICDHGVLGFFRDLRNVNIHVEPVKPVQHVNIGATENITVSEGVRITLTDKSCSVVGSYESPSETDPVVAVVRPKVSVVYKFDGWQGSEGVPSLVERYLKELNAFIEEGTKRGSISG